MNTQSSLSAAHRNFRPATARVSPGRAARAIGILGLVCLSGHAGRAQTTILGSTGGYAVMAGSTLTNNGATTIEGNLGAANFAGSGSLTLTGTQVSPITVQNQSDFTKAFDGLVAMSPTANLTGLVLGTSSGATVLTPGVYHFDTTAQLTGSLVLDAQNQSNAVWVFQIGSTFTTAANATVTFVNLAANSSAADGVFWQVGTATTIGADTTLAGNLLGGTTFDFGTGATISNGRALTGTGTITLGGNAFDFVGPDSGYSGGLAFVGGGNVISAIPEPATYALLAGMGALVAAIARRRSLAR